MSTDSSLCPPHGWLMLLGVWTSQLLRTVTKASPFKRKWLGSQSISEVTSTGDSVIDSQDYCVDSGLLTKQENLLKIARVNSVRCYRNNLIHIATGFDFCGVTRYL